MTSSSRVLLLSLVICLTVSEAQTETRAPPTLTTITFPPDTSTTLAPFSTTIPGETGAGCELTCPPNTECFQPDPTTAPTCICGNGFSGKSCEIQDFCVTDPCRSAVQTCENTPDGRKCYCEGDFKGFDCSIEDVPVQCMNEEVLYYLDGSPQEFCLNVTTSEGDMCYDPVENLVFSAPNITGYIQRVDRGEGMFCLGANLTNPPPDVSRECIYIVAHEVDDVQLRPFRNSTAFACFIFNRPFPSIYVNPDNFVVNLGNPTTASTEVSLKLVNISVSDENNLEESWTFSILDVVPDGMRSYFSMQGNTVLVQIPSNKRDALAGQVANVTVLGVDGGSPALTSSATLRITFLKTTLICSVNSDPVLVNLDPPTNGPFANITCQGYQSNQLELKKLTNDPFEISSVGELILPGTGEQLPANTWLVSVRISVIEPVSMTTDISFSVIAGIFIPACPSPALITFNETDPPQTCRTIHVDLCSDGLTIETGVEVTCSLLSESKLFRMTCLRTEFGIDVKLCTVSNLTGNVGSFSLLGEVSNRFGSQEVQFVANVADVNEAPQCSLSNAPITIKPTQVIGSQIATILCTDPDVTSPNNVFTYAINPMGSRANEFLQIENTTGRIVVANTLENSGVTSLSFMVTVTDGGGLNASVPVTVNVVGDYAPICSITPVSHTVTENIILRVCFPVQTGCHDPVSNEQLEYNQTMQGNGSNLFRLTDGPAIDNQLVLCTTQPLKEKYYNWTLQFSVTSSHGSTLVDVVIQVLDVNDPPAFFPIVYTANITDNDGIGQVLVPNTTDSDSGAFSALLFSAPALSRLSFLTINQTTGAISVVTQVDADVLQPIYTFEIRAVDGGGLTAVAEVTLHVNDVNDNGPTCESFPEIVDVTLLHPIDAMIYQLNCSDLDVSPPFSKQKYSIISATAQIFEVNSNGTVMLTSLLQRNVTSYTVVVDVRDPELSETVTQSSVTVNIVIRVNNKIPPSCEPIPSVEILRETHPVGHCLPEEVVCTDMTGGQISLVSQQGNGTELMDVRTHDTSETNKLKFNVCVRSNLTNRLGTYQVSAIISNFLDLTNLTWIVKVQDVNERPEFKPSFYNVSVSENINWPEVVITISVTDPDKATEAFRLVKVNGNLTNNGNFTSETAKSVLWSENGRVIYVINQQNATIRDLYVFELVATDGQGLNATATVQIHILDVNEPPICPSTLVKGTLRLLSEVKTEAARLDCFDTDLYANNTRLGYRITSGDSGDFFEVMDNGSVILRNTLSRYNSGRHTLQVEVFDHGEVELSTDLLVIIEVDTQVPAKCSPQITPPKIWVFDSCLNLTMYCIDPTLATTDHLTYDVTGDYGNNFTVSSINDGVITMCYNTTGDGNYTVFVTVNNGLKAVVYEMLVQVQYERATPKFNKSQQSIKVMENFTVFDTLLTLAVTTELQIGDLVVSINDEGSTEGWQDHVQLSDLTLTSVASLRPLADTNLVLKVQVEDTGSKLKSSAQVIISVIDVNEAPTCVVISSDLALTVEEAVGKTVVRFRCNDVDVKQEYRTLRYAIVGELVSNTFELVTSSDFHEIQVSNPLLVGKTNYRLSLTVDDGGVPALRYQQLFDINVDLTPPKVKVGAEALKSDVIQVRWNYTRVAFYGVTKGYNVTLVTEGSVIQSPNLPGTQTQWEATNLRPNSSYSVSVTAITVHGNVQSAVVYVSTPVIPIILTGTVSIKWLTRIFDPLLGDKDSQKYFETTETVKKEVEAVLGSSPGYVGLIIYLYRPGSIIVDIGIQVNQYGNVYDTMNTLGTAVSDGFVGDMDVDSSYFLSSGKVGILQVEQVQSNVSTANEGTGLSVTCDITAIAYTSAENITIWWTFKGNRVLPTTTSRFQILPTDVKLELGKLTSVLTVRSVRKTDEGIYECNTRERPGPVSSSDTTVAVIAKPVVSVLPRSQTLDSGASVNITCTLLSPTDRQHKLVLYKDGVKLNSATDETVEQTDTMVTLTVTNVVRNVVYGCEGHNIAGVGVRQSSSIWVLDTVKDVVCDEETINNVQWPVTAPGGVALAACRTGNSGEIRRKCNTTGWLPSQNFCVRDQVSAVQTQIDQIKDGSGQETVRDALQPLVDATEDVQLTEGELLATQDILDVVADISEATDDIDEVETERFLEIASNVIDTINYPSWQSEIDQEDRGAISVAGAVERYLHSVAQKQLKLVTEDDYVKRYQQRNLYTEIGRGRRGSYDFPNITDGSIPGWVDSTTTGISVPGESLEDLPVVEYTSAFYRNMSGILTRKLKRDGKVVDVKDEMDLNADIFSFKVARFYGQLSPPAIITFEHFDSNFSKPVCVYWDFGERAWSTEGCSLISSTDEYTECACDHFTNFAVLMSPGKTPEADMLALSIISAVGCGISMLCIVILLILFALVWRYIKSDRHVLMVHLCIALLISYALFLGGVNRAENKDACTAIAALLHYFYLVVFFLMLGFGVEIAVAVIYVFATKSRLKWLLPLAWGIPAVIVAISLGVTQLEGYGNDQFCWLSIEGGLLWAFVGPAALVLLINFIIVIVVFKQMFRTSSMLTKTDREKAKTSLRSMCVLLPILGLGWVFGIFSVNEKLVVFQYIFAVCNSLQGLFILLFHGILNHQLHDALRKKRDRKRSLATIESSLKQQSSSAGQTTFIKDDSTKRSDSDQLKPKGSNPFLEADRQVQELVKKHKNDNNTQGNRLYDNAVKNNLLAKPTQSGTDGIDLEDVKISNILRESEVMSGTSGISSILPGPAETKVEDERNVMREEPPKTEAPIMRQSTASSHKYDYIDAATVQPKPDGYEKLLQPYEKKLSSTYNKRDSDPTRRTGPMSANERQRMDPGYRGSGESQLSAQGSKERLERTPKSSTGKSSRSSRSDDDVEARMKEHMDRIHNVYLPEAYESSEAAKQARVRVAEAMPIKYNPKASRKDSSTKKLQHSGKAKDMAAAKKQHQSKKKPSKDRSKAYQYQYDMAYMGNSSRHASLENVPVHFSGFNPYAGPSMHHYPQQGQQGQQGHHGQQWDQYQWQQRW